MVSSDVIPKSSSALTTSTKSKLEPHVQYKLGLIGARNQLQKATNRFPR